MWLEGGASLTNVTRELTASLVFLLWIKLVYTLYRLYSDTVQKKTTFVYSSVLLIPTLTINDTVHLYSVYTSWLHIMGTRNVVSILMALVLRRLTTSLVPMLWSKLVSTLYRLYAGLYTCTVYCSHCTVCTVCTQVYFTARRLEKLSVLSWRW